MNAALLKWAALAFLVGSISAHASLLTITPTTGNVAVGDTLVFTASIDSIAPPSGGRWVNFFLGVTSGPEVGAFRVRGPDGNPYPGFTGACEDLSELPEPLDYHCANGSSSATWNWTPFSDETRTVAGDLFRFSVLFFSAGTFDVYLDNALATFTTHSEFIPIAADSAHPIHIQVGVSTSVPEPGTLALFGIGLAGLGFARRKQ